MVSRLFFIHLHSMKLRNLLFLVVGVFIICFFSSCGAVLYGTSTKVTIEADNGREDNVNIVTIGPKKIKEYKNVSLPAKIKVKHNNFPLSVDMYSETSLYTPFTIQSVFKGDNLAIIGVVGGSLITLTGGISYLISGVISMPLVYTGLGMLLGVGSVTTEIPERKFYQASSLPVDTNNVYMLTDTWRNAKYIDDASKWLTTGYLDRAETMTDWLMTKEKTSELHYLKGVTYYKKNNLSMAKKQFDLALKMDGIKEDSVLYNNVVSYMDEINAINTEKKQERTENMKVALSVAATAAATVATASLIKNATSSSASTVTSSTKESSGIMSTTSSSSSSTSNKNGKVWPEWAQKQYRFAKDKYEEAKETLLKAEKRLVSKDEPDVLLRQYVEQCRQHVKD